jgi:hypothetical protein
MVGALLVMLAMTDSPQERLERNARVVAAIYGVHELTTSGDSDPRHIEAVVDELHEPDDLRRFALAAHAMTNGLAEFEPLDNVYWAAFWAAARKLAKSTDESSVLQLSLVAEHARLGGGELMTMNELRAAQSKRRALHKQ